MVLYLLASYSYNDTCVVEGDEYRFGEKIFPSYTCLECVCQKGFVEGKYELPFCKNALCREQLRSHGPSIQASCAPVYSKSEPRGILCCSQNWLCRETFCRYLY